MIPLHWLAPAKLNLFLHLIGRRADGYHKLQTAFQLLDYYDELEFTRHLDRQISFSCDVADDAHHIDRKAHPEIYTHDNLLVKTAVFLQKTYKPSGGVTIHLKKRIPIGAGLGGGSSDTATTLLALNQLWELQLTHEELMTIALRFGADVPLFVQGKTAWGEGIGEQLVPHPFPKDWFIVVIPKVIVSTEKLYSMPQLTCNALPITISTFLNDCGQTRNDFEVVVREIYPVVAEALDRLNSLLPARLTGSGGCIFARTDNRERAEAILQQVSDRFVGFVSQGIDQSPGPDNRHWGVAKR